MPPGGTTSAPHPVPQKRDRSGRPAKPWAAATASGPGSTVAAGHEARRRKMTRSGESTAPVRVSQKARSRRVRREIMASRRPGAASTDRPQALRRRCDLAQLQPKSIGSSTKDRWTTFLSYSLTESGCKFPWWHLRHTSPTKGPCYRTPAVPSRSAGVSASCCGVTRYQNTSNCTLHRVVFHKKWPRSPRLESLDPHAPSEPSYLAEVIDPPARLDSSASARRT
jgi:hypothetical protein